MCMYAWGSQRTQVFFIILFDSNSVYELRSKNKYKYMQKSLKMANTWSQDAHKAQNHFSERAADLVKSKRVHIMCMQDRKKYVHTSLKIKIK